MHAVRRPRLGVRTDSTTITSLRLQHGAMIMFNDNDANMRICAHANVCTYRTQSTPCQQQPRSAV